MLSVGRVRRLTARTVILTLTGALVVIGLQQPVSARTAKPHGTAAVPAVAGYPPVSTPSVSIPKALPKRTGSVPLQPSLRIASDPARSTARGSAAEVTAAAVTDKVGVRALVIATDASDWGIATWKATLDRVGAAYDVLLSATTPLTSSTLLRSDGAGRYNAILLTSSMLLYSSGGSYLSGLDTTEWNTLWAYERDYGVRQAALSTSYGTWPEDYCLRGISEGGIGDTPLIASLTATGAGIFDYLKSTAQIPIVQSYVYRTVVGLGCNGDPVLTAGSDVLGVRSTSTDGRERLALTFTSNQYLTQSNLLVFGLLRWASKGIFLGEQRHYLHADIDDWLNTSDHYYPDGHIEYTPGYRPSSAEAANLAARQAALRAAYPQAGNLVYNLAYNGSDADAVTTGTCAADGSSVNLTATTRCLANQFQWLNHTYNHPELNFTDYATTYAEIANNRAAATALGLPEAPNVLKTPEYSGLGVYSDDPNNDTDPPTDHGLAASNPNLLLAAQNLGITYLHGNMSFASHVPSCFNCGIVHPLNSAITVVTDYPTNIAYFTTTPDEETAFYNAYYGPNGKFPFWSRNLTYSEIIDYEAGQALNQLASGVVNTHTFHIANTRDYGSGRTLLTDWTEQVLAKYTALYSVPLLSLTWSSIGQYATTRTGHFAQLAGGVDAVYDRTTGTIAVTSPVAGTVQLTGAQATGSGSYGTDTIAEVTLTAGTPVTVTAVPRA
jgi:hypothetical protein